MIELLTSPLFLRSLIAALLVGVSAPVVGTYLVHRRLAMLGDGIGHVALTGVALGWLVGSAANLVPVDQLAVPGALLASVAAAVAIELIRQSGRTSADVVLAVLFYGGIAAGVVLIGLAGGTSTQLNSYLFGSLATVSWSDLIIIAVMAIVIFVFGIGLRGALFSVTSDEDFATATGLPVRGLSMLIAVLSAVTVAVSMRVVGALLVSALMIVPVATSGLFSKSFKGTMAMGTVLGGILCVAGLWITFYVNVSPGAMIVVLAVTVYAVAFFFRTIADRSKRKVEVHH
ncbi:iron chelate uptake ABC transporter family permease subunit [Actinomycetaceae bacterium MB13-C1-2]|nr:iron chelate uptake ABC transporter family permease subunit [Actinomycetaceae bacterium MB13-C1-2]